MSAPASRKHSLYQLHSDFIKTGKEIIERIKADSEVIAKSGIGCNQLNIASDGGESQLETMPHLDTMFDRVCMTIGIPISIEGVLAAPAGEITDRKAILIMDALHRIAEGKPYSGEELASLDEALYRLSGIAAYMDNAESMRVALTKDMSFFQGKTVIEDEHLAPYCSNASESSKKLVSSLMEYLKKKAQEGGLESRGYLGDVQSSQTLREEGRVAPNIFDIIRLESSFAGLSRGAAVEGGVRDVASTSSLNKANPLRSPIVRSAQPLVNGIENVRAAG